MQARDNLNMPSTWTVRVLVAVPLAIIVVLVARTYMKNRRVDYWTLAEDANKPNDRDAQLRILFVGNSFIHYNGGAEKVLSLLHICKWFVTGLQCTPQRHSMCV